MPNTLGSSHLRPQRERTKVTTRLVMGGVAWQPNKRAAKKPSNYGEDPTTATLMNEKEGTSLYILLPDRLSEETRAHSVMQSEQQAARVLSRVLGLGVHTSMHVPPDCGTAG